MTAAHPDDDLRRVAQLHELGVLDTPADPVLDGLVACAASLSGWPMALVSLVDAQRQWFKARHGVPFVQTPREGSFCDHVVRANAPLIVPDALADPTHAHSPLVTGGPRLRAYAGFPVRLGEQVMGTLCVLDTQARQLTPEQQAHLEQLALAVSHWLHGQLQQRVLLLQQQRLKDFAAISADWFWETDAQHHLTWASDATQTSQDLPSPDWVGYRADDLVVLDLAGNPLLQPVRLSDIMALQDTFRHCVVRRQVGDAIRYLTLNGFPLRDGQGRFRGYRGATRDITERVTARRQARSRDELLHKLTQYLPGFVYQYRRLPDGRSHFPFASQGVREIYELEPDQIELDAAPVFGRLHPDDLDAVADSIACSARELTTWSATYRVRLPQRGVRWMQGLASPEALPDGSVLWHGFISDITDQRELELAHQQAQAAQRERDAQTRFLSRLSHELRTPLNAILGFAQLLRRDARLNATHTTWLDHIQHAGDSLLHLVNQVLQIGRLREAGERNPLQLEPVALDSALERSLALALPAATQASACVRRHGAWSSTRVLADRQALEQILLNLLSNAVKYNRPNGCIDIDVQALPGQVEIGIRDQGAGLSAQQQSQLFQPFNRLGAEAGPVAGHGLGLVIARSLACAMQGELGVHSQAGQGARFYLRLPAVPAEEPVTTTA